MCADVLGVSARGGKLCSLAAAEKSSRLSCAFGRLRSELFSAAHDVWTHVGLFLLSPVVQHCVKVPHDYMC